VADRPARVRTGVSIVCGWPRLIRNLLLPPGGRERLRTRRARRLCAMWTRNRIASISYAPTQCTPYLKPHSGSTTQFSRRLLEKRNRTRNFCIYSPSTFSEGKQ
jgi:hypothetical protein